MQTIETIIADHPFARGMKPAHIRMLAEFAMEMTFSEGEQIFREGDVANRFYLILDGEVAIESRPKSGDAQPVIIQRLKGGDVLGWSWIFPPHQWNFDARALRATRAIFFYGTRLLERCEADSEFGAELMKRVSQVMLERLQFTRRQLVRRSTPEDLPKPGEETRPASVS